MAKYTDARYPEKINDLVDNEGKVNPSAVESGIQLYKHKVTITANYGGDEVIETFIFYSTSSESFVGKEQSEIDFIQGFFLGKEDSDTSWTGTILGSNQFGNFLYYDCIRETVSLIEVYDKPYFLTDIITKL